MFSYLYELGNAAKCGSDDENLYVIAAQNGEERALMLTHYRADKVKTEKQITLKLDGVTDGIWQAQILDDEHTMAQSFIEVKGGEASLTIPSDCVIMLKNKISEELAR
jgi:hypothetical protein